MKKKIQEKLSEIEQRHNVVVLYACEAGSRAWGFPSQDSDYDIRFIYVRSKHEYLALNIETQRDVIEDKTNALLDFDGWDLRKALKLLKKCNPPLFEWMRSDIVYKQDNFFVRDMKELLPRYYDYPAMCYHYLHMAKGNNRDYLQGDEVWVKKYFYVLRPMLAVMYLMEHNKIPPLEFQELLNTVVHPGRVRNEIAELLLRKMEGDELDRGPRMPVISDYIDQNMSALANIRFLPTGKCEKSWAPLNTLFLQTLKDYINHLNYDGTG